VTVTSSIEADPRVVVNVVTAGAWVGVLLVGGVGAMLIVKEPVDKKASGWVALVIVSSAAAFDRVTVPTVNQSAQVRAHGVPRLHDDVDVGSSLEKIRSRVTGVWFMLITALVITSSQWYQLLRRTMLLCGLF
jgi:hypothetical protein